MAMTTGWFGDFPRTEKPPGQPFNGDLQDPTDVGTVIKPYFGCTSPYIAPKIGQTYTYARYLQEKRYLSHGHWTYWTLRIFHPTGVTTEAAMDNTIRMWDAASGLGLAFLDLNGWVMIGYPWLSRQIKQLIIIHWNFRFLEYPNQHLSYRYHQLLTIRWD